MMIQVMLDRIDKIKPIVVETFEKRMIRELLHELFIRKSGLKRENFPSILAKGVFLEKNINGCRFTCKK